MYWSALVAALLVSGSGLALGAFWPLVNTAGASKLKSPRPRTIIIGVALWPVEVVTHTSGQKPPWEMTEMELRMASLDRRLGIRTEELVPLPPRSSRGEAARSQLISRAKAQILEIQEMRVMGNLFIGLP